MTTPHFTGTKVFHATPPANDNRQPWPDPWRPLCEFCRLDDCCRTEGDVSAQPTNRRYPGCRIYDAAAAGLTAEQALQEAQNGD